MSKTKKVLSIILITLLILSTIFTLCKKVGLCADSSSNPTVYNPPPFLVGEGIGSYDTVSRSLVLNMIDDAINRNPNGANQPIILQPFYSDYYVGFLTGTPVYTGFNNNQWVDYTVTYQYDSNGVLINSYTSGGQLQIENLGVFETINNGSYYKTNDRLQYPIYIRNCENFYFTNGSLVFADSSNISNAPGFNNNFWENYQDSVDYVDNNNSIWKPNYQNPSNQQGFWDTIIDFLNRFFKSLIAGFFSAAKTIGAYIEQGINFLYEFLTGYWDFLFEKLDSFFDLFRSHKETTEDIGDDTSGIATTTSNIYTLLSSFFGNFWGNFSNKLEDFTQGIWGDLPDIMKTPYRIAQWFYQHGLNNGEFDFMTLWHYLFDFDSTSALNSFSNNKYGDFVLDVRDFFSTFFGSISDQTASSRVFFVIPIGSHFGSDVGDVEINFDWYTSIRDQYLPYFMAFLYISVIWLFFKRLPDILRGVAGAESSFIDSLPYDTEHITHTSSGVYTSNTHVSNGGRSRVTYNSFKKN